MRRYLLICLLGGGVALCGCQRDESVDPEAAEQTRDVVTSQREETAGQESVEEGTIQVVVRSLSLGERSVAETRDVRYLPFADTAGEHELVVGMALEAGDLLSSRSGDAVVGLDCGGSTAAVLSAKFRVLINGTEGERCVLDLMSGSLDVLADAPTQVNVGGVVLGTEGTAYTV